MKPIKYTLLTFLFCNALLILAGQNNFSASYLNKFIPKSTTIHYRLGETLVPIKLIQYGERKDIVYINLHDDEQTSVNAAKILLQKEGGVMIRISNREKRNIRFRLKGRYYTFDPNSMFSDEGASKSLDLLGNTSKQAVTEVTKFSDRILQLIPENVSCIVALHNNTKGNFGINSYLPGEERETDAKLVFKNPGESQDDIFLTTDSLLYQNLASEKYNTILQDNENVRRDGSLSVYCGERNIRYVNCETEHGKANQYLTMLMTLKQYINSTIPDALVYEYLASLPSGVSFSSGNNIYFGDKLIGIIKTIEANEESEEIMGKLEIDKNFRLWSNMDYFFFSAGGSPRIELRIDPTREKKAFNISSEKIRIVAK